MSTTIGDILDNFFSPISREKLWIMPAGDNYTKVVRQWTPVKKAVNLVKAHLVANCATWSAKHRTSTTWKARQDRSTKDRSECLPQVGCQSTRNESTDMQEGIHKICCFKGRGNSGAGYAGDPNKELVHVLNWIFWNLCDRRLHRLQQEGGHD